MKIRIAAVVLLALISLAEAVSGGNVTDGSVTQSTIDSLATKLANNEIARVEVVQIPPQVLTRSRITPEMLETTYRYKLTIRDMRGSPYQQGLADAMGSTSVQPQPDIADLRWGIIFYDLDDSRIGAVYFNKRGNVGAVDSVAVAYKGRLLNWLDDNFSKIFR